MQNENTMNVEELRNEIVGSKKEEIARKKREYYLKNKEAYLERGKNRIKPKGNPYKEFALENKISIFQAMEFGVKFLRKNQEVLKSLQIIHQLTGNDESVLKEVKEIRKQASLKRDMAKKLQYIKKYNENLSEEKKQERREYKKKWDEEKRKNKEYIEECARKKREYYLRNREKIKEKQKIYYEENKEKNK